MNWKKILIGITIIVLFLVTLYGTLSYLSYRNYIPKEEVNKRFQDYSVLGSIILGFMTLTFYLVIKFIEKKWGKEFKELVNLKDAESIMREEFIKGTKMPYYIDRSEDKNGVIKTAHQDDLIVYRDSHSYSHPNTGTPTWKAEFNARTGLQRGINLVQVRLDLGKDYLRNNWFQFIKAKTPSVILPYEERKYPLYTPESENSRLVARQMSLIEEGEEDKKIETLRQLMLKEEDKKKQPPLTPEEEELKEETQKIQSALNLSKIKK